MADKNKKTAFAKYAVAAVAALLIIGVTVTTVMIKAKRKEVVVIESNSKSTADDSSTIKEVKTNTKQNKEKSNDSSEAKKQNKPAETKADTEKAPIESTTSFPIDINKANLAQLCTIEGVGESTAKRILDYREKVGIIRSMRQLLNVEGIGERTLKKLEQYLYVNENDKAIAADVTVTSKTTSSKKTSKTGKTSAVKTTTTAKSEPTEVNINKADAEEIAKALLISVEDAQKIVDIREQIGGFKAKPEILLSKAISENEYLRLEKYILI